ncbi:MAG TPA: hypothetical protein VLV81_05985 [Acidimicrobiia bacterium]|nr:hypothetical protein [Acidimicrobiia bacterium]
MTAAGPAGLDAGLAAVDGFLGPDGASVTVDGWDTETGRLDLRLVLESPACAECVVPRPMLDRLLLDALRRHVSAVRAITLVDPREAGTP